MNLEPISMPWLETLRADLNEEGGTKLRHGHVVNGVRALVASSLALRDVNVEIVSGDLAPEHAPAWVALTQVVKVDPPIDGTWTPQMIDQVTTDYVVGWFGRATAMDLEMLVFAGNTSLPDTDRRSRALRQLDGIAAQASRSIDASEADNHLAASRHRFVARHLRGEGVIFPPQTVRLMICDAIEIEVGEQAFPPQPEATRLSSTATFVFRFKVALDVGDRSQIVHVRKEEVPPALASGARW